MNREDILGYALIAFILIICIKIYTESDSFNLKCIISDVDGNQYCVRERNKLTLVADFFPCYTKAQKLVAHMKEQYPNRDNVKRLVEDLILYE